MVASIVVLWSASSTSASVEVWVAVTTTLLLANFAMGSIGPRFFSSRRLVAPVVRLLYTVNDFSVSYTLGLMKHSPSPTDDGDDGDGGGAGAAPTVNDLLQVWAVLLVTLRDSSRIGQPYRSKDMTMVDLVSSLWSANQLRTRTRPRLTVLLWLIWSVHTLRVVWHYVSSNRAAEATKGNIKLVSDYMSMSPHSDDNASPATMQGYRYIVAGEEEQATEVRLPGFTLEMELETTTTRSPAGSTTAAAQSQLLTVDKVWNQDSTDRLLGSMADGDSRFKDACLSFALYKLQRRRFYDFPIAEAAHPATRRLISGAILEEGRGRGVPLPPTNGEYERAFRVTEVELSFLHDFFYSKHAVVFAGGFPYVRLMLSALMAASVSYLFSAVVDLPASGTAVAGGKRPKHLRFTHGVLIAHYVIAVVLCRELIELVVYVFSQWTKVRIVCHYAKLEPQQRQGWMGMVFEKLARAMFRVSTRGQWDQRIGQYNLLVAMLQPSKHPMLARFHALCRWPGIRAFITKKVKLQCEAKRALFRSLENLIGSIPSPSHTPSSESADWAQQMNGLLASYFRNAFMDADGSPPPQPIADAVGDDQLVSETHKILVWHIATSLCQIKLLQEAGQPVVDLHSTLLPETPSVAAVWPHYVTAVTLSNYCAYLVTEALVPDNGLVANGVFGAVCDEVREALCGCTSAGEICGKLRPLAHDDRMATMILGMGVRLSEQLMSSYGSTGELWERLAKFWAGFLLDLSASTKASKHKIYLERCGELTTHLWLLLSHAGFLGRNSHGEQLLDPVDLSNA